MMNLNTLLDTLTDAPPWLLTSASTALKILAITAIAWLSARLLSRLTRDLIERSGADALAERVGAARMLYAVGYHGGFASLTSSLSAAAIWLVALHIIFEQLGLSALASAFLSLLDYAPSVLAAIAILFAGSLGASLLSRLVAGDGDEGSLAATSAYYLAMAVCVSVALKQLGLEMTLIHGLIKTLYASAALLAAATFAVSARFTMRAIIARRYIAQLVSSGDLIRTPELSGYVRALDELHLVVTDADDPSREHLLPYHTLLQTPLTIAAETSPQDAVA
jgi:hypothetical protein